MGQFNIYATRRGVRTTLPPILLPFIFFASFCSNSSSSEIDFEKQVAPILTANCLKCHNSQKARAGLDLSSRASALKGSEAGEVLVPGKPEESLLVQRASDGSMPPEADGRRLTPEEAGALAEWVKEGASWPEPLILKVSPDKNLVPGPAMPAMRVRRRLRIGRVRHNFRSRRDLSAAEQRGSWSSRAGIRGSTRPAPVEPIGKRPVAAAAGEAEGDERKGGNGNNFFHNESPY